MNAFCESFNKWLFSVEINELGSVKAAEMRGQEQQLETLGLLKVTGVSLIDAAFPTQLLHKAVVNPVKHVLKSILSL